MVFDSIELLSGFLRTDRIYELNPLNIALDDYHWYFIGRYLAQLHCSGQLMRDASRDNVMFRLSDGYPVLIDDPIENQWGDRAEVLVSDLFVPATSLAPETFEAFCCGYVENLQRLYVGPQKHLVDDILALTGGDIMGVPFVGAPSFMPQLGALLKDEPCDLTASDPELVWLSIVLRFHGLCPASLEARVEPLLRAAGAAAWPRETALLRRFAQLMKESPDGETNELSFMSNFGLRSFVDVAGAQDGDDWGVEFALFWVRTLCAISRQFEDQDETLAIQAVQTAHIVLQYAQLPAAVMYRGLHNIRCATASSTWYWRAPASAGEQFMHQCAFRNTECISISKLIDLISRDRDPSKPPPLQLMFDLVELRRNLIGNTIDRYQAGGEAKEPLENLASMLMPALVQAVRHTTMDLIDYFSQHQDTCYYFGWRLREFDDVDLPGQPKRAKSNESDEGGEKKNDRQMPVGMHDLLWTLHAMKDSLGEDGFKSDAFVRSSRWEAALWGGSWYTPFDRLQTPAQQGFRPMLQDKSGPVLRAGCGMIVFDRIVLDDGRPAQVMELLWPIPGHKSPTYHGDEARP
jgi:hypothetical protein